MVALPWWPHISPPFPVPRDENASLGRVDLLLPSNIFLLCPCLGRSKAPAKHLLMFCYVNEHLYKGRWDPPSPAPLCSHLLLCNSQWKARRCSGVVFTAWNMVCSGLEWFFLPWPESLQSYQEAVLSPHFREVRNIESFLPVATGDMPRM